MLNDAAAEAVEAIHLPSRARTRDRGASPRAAPRNTESSRPRAVRLGRRWRPRGVLHTPPRRESRSPEVWCHSIGSRGVRTQGRSGDRRSMRTPSRSGSRRVPCSRRSRPIRHRGGSRRPRASPTTRLLRGPAATPRAIRPRRVRGRGQVLDRLRFVPVRPERPALRPAVEPVRRHSRPHLRDRLKQGCAAVAVRRWPLGAAQILENEH